MLDAKIPNAFRHITPQTVRNLLQQRRIAHADVATVLEFCMKDNCPNALEGLYLIPLLNGQVAKFTRTKMQFFIGNAASCAILRKVLTYFVPQLIVKVCPESLVENAALGSVDMLEICNDSRWNLNVAYCSSKIVSQLLQKYFNSASANRTPEFLSAIWEYLPVNTFWFIVDIIRKQTSPTILTFQSSLQLTEQRSR